MLLSLCLENLKFMEIKELGKVAFVDKLTSPFVQSEGLNKYNFRDDCTVLEGVDRYNLISTKLFMEGIHFDLTYTPLKHIGYKCVVAALSDVLAMNGTATNILIALAIPSRFAVEHIEELYEGVKIACDKCSVVLSGGDTTSSINGLSISVTAYGSADKDKITYRSGAKLNDLICITGDLGSAYLGTVLFEREKKILAGNDVSKPHFEGYEYQLGKALKPPCRKDVIETLSKNSLTPTSMIDISDGLASSLLHICRESDCSAKIFLDKLPIASSSFTLADELKTDAIIAAMNGGEDYELMFTIGVDRYEDVIKCGGIDVIGHISTSDHSPVLVTPDGGEISIQAQGWTAE